MFGRKDENEPKLAMDERAADGEAAPAEDDSAGAAPLPLKNPAAGPVTPPRRPTARPEIVRRPRDYTSAGTRDEHGMGGGYNDGKKLVVGREIALSGNINSCEKLVVQGRVEANMTDCSEIEITETGTFKGQAEVDVAEINGTFEGSLLARELLLVRSSGRVSGDVRYSRLEIERGGEIDGDIHVFSAPEEEAAG